jgi:predicted choloylglycine hydrolase
MYHPRFKGSHYEIGLTFGKRLKKNNADFNKIIKLNEFQQNFGIESQKILLNVFPEVCDEIRGMTDGLNYSYDKFASWLLCMGCCYDPKGCTVFSFEHDNNIFYGRNNDLPPFLKKSSISAIYEFKKGYSFIGNTSAMINFEEGLNEKGLVASMTFVFPNKIVPGLSSVFLVRYLLEKCETTREAVNALQNLPIASVCNILLIDKKGDMLVAECSPDKIFLRKPAKDENFVITVNHLTSDEMKNYYADNMDKYFPDERLAAYDALKDNDNHLSNTRYKTAYNALKDIEFIDGVEHSKDILSGKHGFMCQYDKKLDFDTIWSSVFDISNNKIYRAEGNPSRTKYKEDIRFNQRLEKIK